MATHHREKQMKKKGFMNFHKFSAKNGCLPKSDPVVLTNYNKSVPAASLSKHSKDFQENCILIGRRRIDDERGGGVQARKSASHVETNLSSVAAFLQVKVLVTDMPGFMQVHAFRCARRSFDSLDKFSSKHMAYNIKKEFDTVYGAAWHCMVGTSFGSFVAHSTCCFLYFTMEKLYISVFKTKVQKALEGCQRKIRKIYGS